MDDPLASIDDVGWIVLNRLSHRGLRALTRARHPALANMGSRKYHGGPVALKLTLQVAGLPPLPANSLVPAPLGSPVLSVGVPALAGRAWAVRHLHAGVGYSTNMNDSKGTLRVVVPSAK
jgi:hypothetical protein